MTKQKIWSAILIIVIVAAMAAGSWQKENGMSKDEAWIRKSIEEWNNSEMVQVKNVKKSTMENGNEKTLAWKVTVDKTTKMICNKTISEDPAVGIMEVTTYFGMEDGKMYQLNKGSYDETYTKQIMEDEGLLESYLKWEAVPLTENSVIEVLGEDTIDGRRYTKVKITTPDFKRLQDRKEMKEMYREAKKSETYQKELAEAEVKYENHKEETIAWFDENRKLRKAKTDTSVNDRFTDAVTRAYLGAMGAAVENEEVLQNSICEQQFLSGEECDKIEIPTEYEILNY